MYQSPGPMSLLSLRSGKAEDMKTMGGEDHYCCLCMARVFASLLFVLIPGLWHIG